MILALQILLVVLVAGFVLLPLYRHRGRRAWQESRDEAARRTIGERKERLYGTIVDLDFDRDSGKISAEDHARMREEAMREVLGVLAEEHALDAREGRVPSGAAAATADGGDAADALERLIEDYKQKRAEPVEVSKG
jgi:cytochrome c-type biogenesis protein CcmI